MSGKYKSKPQWVINSFLLEWVLSKRQEITRVGEDVENKEPLYIISGNVNLCNHYGKQYGGFSKKKKTIIWFRNSTSTYVFEENENTNFENM